MRHGGYVRAMNWQQVCDNKQLQDLPYKIELNRWGKIEMSPHRKEHSAFQGEISYLLRVLLPLGKALSECAIDTSEGVKVADAAWVSKPRWKAMSKAASCSTAPEICVEVASDSNTKSEMEMKRKLYMKAGALEFWFCDSNGKMSFFHASGKIKRSTLCPDFPPVVRL